MCYKVATPDFDELQEFVGPKIKVHEFEMYYHANGFGRPWLPVQLNSQPDIIQPVEWGLLPAWVKPDDVKKYTTLTLNARSEEIFEKSSYKNYIGKNRGLLWVKGFYDSQKVSPKDKQPYFIYHKTKEPFTIGCVYSNWHNKVTDTRINTFSLITTSANALMSEIHNSPAFADEPRMPLIIPANEREHWLSDMPKEEIASLMVPYADGLLEAHKVDKIINNSKQHTNYPEIQNVIANDSLF